MCEILGMPSIHIKTHQEATKIVHKSALAVMETATRTASDIVRELYEPDEDGIVNVAVSFDGTWHKRGHTSNHGVAAIICAVSGLVIDSLVMSLHCQLCKTKGKSLEGSADFDQWMETHKPKCQQNYTESAGGMEVEAARVMWGRSLSHKMRYTTMISDGDSKTYNALVAMRPYGDIGVQKAECVNQVAKRLGAGLRNLVAEEKSVVSLWEEEEKIGRLQSYFTKAVRSHNVSVEDMSATIWAAFDHSTSCDDNPKHARCPSVPDSWCFYNRSLANGQRPPSHEGRLSTFLNATVAPFVHRVYARLTDPALLEKCLLGKTQNTNESFHSTLWIRCPKHVFVSAPRVAIAAALEVGEWNYGSIVTRSLMFHLSLPITDTTIKLGQKRDMRIKGARRAAEEPQKKRREKWKTAIEKEQQREVDGLDGPAYEPGAGAY